jgi:DNA repair protein RadD
MLNLRSYQENCLDALRDGFKQGNNAQILYAPTGAGKTEMAIALLKATKDKGNKAAMVLDRIILCDQTSNRLQRYDIDHGVLQSGHWRYRPYEDIQVCSAQTLEKRGSFPGLSLLIVDECHATRTQTVEFIKKNPDIKVIGLTATPFTKGLGKIYKNVISTVTTKQLVDDKILVPLRVFISKEINMDGVKKVAGEWNQKDTENRGMTITGDVVSSWVQKTNEIFGKPVKTIVFSCGVNHGQDLARRFAEAGYNFVSVSYKDDDKYKREVIEDFSKPDTEIHGLIATDVLTKGFDVPDVLIGISARPFSKSLSSHIQQMGRVMRGSPGKEFAVWIDHSGNYIRFREDWDEIYEHGVDALDEGKEKPKPEKTEREKQDHKCPSCNALWPTGSDTCLNCGYVRKSKSLVSELPGELSELQNRVNGALTKEQFWAMCRYQMATAGWSSGRAAHTYREKFGVWPRNLDDVSIMQPNPEFQRFVKAKLIRYLKGMRRI